MLNARGAASSDFKRVFLDFMNTYKPSLVLISETRVGGTKAQKIMETFGFSSWYAIDPMGYAGGLWLLWDR